MRRFWKALKSGNVYTTMPVLVFLVFKLTGIVDWSWWWAIYPAFAWWLLLLALGVAFYSVSIVVAIIALPFRR